MGTARKDQHKLAEEIVRRLVPRHSIATVLFHEAVAERLGLGPTDHKCLDLLRERGAMTGSDLAGITDLTSGAITGVVARLEHAGFLRREPDPHDRRQQILSPALDRIQDIHLVFAPIRNDVIALLERFDTHQLSAIAEFLTRSTELADRHVALLRAQTTAQRAGRSGRRKHLTPAGTRTRLGRPPKLRRKRT